MDGLGSRVRYAGAVFVVGCRTPLLRFTFCPPPGEGSGGAFGRLARGSYLVDSASSHMLVSKIKPCMSKYKHFVL
jgi:hypothetical protein